MSDIEACQRVVRVGPKSASTLGAVRSNDAGPIDAPGVHL